MEAIRQQLEQCFQEVFNREEIIISQETTAFDIEEWDSLMHINLIIAIEESFDMRFTVPELTGLENVGDMMQLIQRKLKTK